MRTARTSALIRTAPTRTALIRTALIRTGLAAGVALTGVLAADAASAHDDGQEVTTTTAATTHSRDGAGRDLAALRRSLADYRDVSAALADGYVPVSECAESPDGGMGVHYLNPQLAMAPVDAEHPAILLYGPGRDGATTLLGAEWFQADADQDLTTDDDRPTLFGRPFDGPMPGHDAQMPVHYDLHVWLYEANPAGVFAPWNPAVTC